VKIFHIFHPSRGHQTWAEGLTDRFKAPWARVTPEHPNHTETLLDWSLKEGVQRLIVWGGDGTFHRVVSGLWRRNALAKMELALVPVGTCNDLARALNLIHYDWARWEADRPTGTLATLSLAHLAWEGNGARGEDIFINNAGFGRPRDSFERKDGTWGVLRSFLATHVKAHWPGGNLEGQYYMALTCNAPYFSGGLHFDKTPNPEDTLLETFVVPATSKPRLALRLLRGRLGLPLADAKVTHVKSDRLTLETTEDVWPQTDGEPPPIVGARRLVFSILPEKVRLWKP